MQYQYGWGNNPDARVFDLAEIHVYTTTKTDPFMLGATSSENDFMFMHDGIKGHDYAYFSISEVYLQQTGDGVVLFVKDGDVDVVLRVTPDTEIFYHLASS